MLRSLIMFQTFISRHNSNFFSDKLVLTSVTPASSAPVLQTPKATSSTLYFDSLTVNAGNCGFLHCIQMDTSVNAANFFFQAEDGIRFRNVTGVQTCALPISGADPRRRPQEPFRTDGRLPRARADERRSRRRGGRNRRPCPDLSTAPPGRSDGRARPGVADRKSVV